MKKLLLLALLVFALVVTAVACTGGETPADTTPETTPAETPTEAGTTAPEDGTTAETTVSDETAAPEETEPQETPTEPQETPTDAPEVPTEEPAPVDPWVSLDEAGKVGHSFDTFRMNGQLYFEADGNSAAKLEAIENTVLVSMGTAHDSFAFRGWIGFAQPIKAFGYAIDGEIVWIEDINASLEATEDAVKQLAGEHGTRFCITIPTAELTTGSHDVKALMLLEDDTVALFYGITVEIEGYAIDETYPHHANIDWINYQAGVTTTPFGGHGHSTIAGNQTVVVDGSTLNVLENKTLTLGGWMGVPGGINKFVYSVNGGEWIDALGGQDGEPLPDHYANSLQMADALKNGLFKSDPAGENPVTEIVADLTAWEGQYVTVQFAAVSEADQLVLLPMITIEGYKVPGPKYNPDGFYQGQDIALGSGGQGAPYTGGAKKWGQRFNTGKAFLTKVNIYNVATYDDGNVNSWSFKVWGWNTDYDTTVAAEPLYVLEGTNHANCASFIAEIPAKLSICGDIYYELEYLDGAKNFTGWTAPEVAEGVETYEDGYIKDGTYISTISVVNEVAEAHQDNHNFQSTATGTNGSDVDLKQAFDVALGTGDPSGIAVSNGAYSWSGFNAAKATANGAYAFTVTGLNATANPGFTAMFFRGLQNIGEKQYFGADGHDGDASSFGCAGIYLTHKDGTLSINVKSYDNGMVPNVFTVAVSSNDFTVVDDGKTTTLYAGSDVVATFAFEGEADYGMGLQSCATVTITWADGSTNTVENALVAAAHTSDLGIATRGAGAMTFTGVSLMPANSVAGGEEDDTPEYYDNLVIDPRTLPAGSITGHQTNIVDNTFAGHFPMINAAGLTTGAMLHQGSIKLADSIDLSKYSKVVIYFATDWGEGTKAGLAAAKENGYGRIGISATDKNGVFNPSGDDFIAEQYTPDGGWAITAHEVDLSGVTYEGPVYVSADFLEAQFIIIDRVEFIGAEIVEAQ